MRWTQPFDATFGLSAWNAMPGWKNTELGIGASNALLQ